MVANKLSNLPKEIAESKRFFSVEIDTDGNKVPQVTGWQYPVNQTTLDKITGLVGFDITGHGQGADYLFVDFDHVLDDNGNFINQKAEQWFTYLDFAESYCEKSISGHGLHFFFKPTSKLFKDAKFTGGNNGSIFLDEHNDKIKIEVFYRQNRYCLLTGDIYSGTSTIVDGEPADEIFQNLINAITAQNPPADTADLPQSDFPIAEAKKALNAIDCKKVSRDTWAQIGMALKDAYADNGFDLWNAWSKTDPDRYSADVCSYQWSKFGINKTIVKPVTIATLIYYAKKFGYKPPRRDEKKLDIFDGDIKQQLADWQNKNGSIKPDILPAIKTALDSLKALSADNITANDVYNNVFNSALACAYGFSAVADNLFTVLKKAKVIARDKLAVNKSGLAAKLSDDEVNNLIAIDVIILNNLREDIERQTSAIAKAHKQFQRDENARLAHERNKKLQAERDALFKSNEKLLAELKAEPQSPERDAKIIQTIRNMCDWKHDKHGNPIEIRPTVANIDRIFPNDPNLDGLIGYDEFQQADVFLKPPVWNEQIKPHDEFRDRDASQLQLYLRRNYAELTNEKLIDNAIISYSDALKFHEVKNFFYRLPKHDKTKRLDSVFIDNLHAEDNSHVREVTTIWFLAAIARIFYPGCDFQLAPILLGEQGIGKSYLLNKIGGKWYGTLIDDVSDPHAIDAIQRLWLVEIKEMASMKKDIDANKRFIDAADDTRRAAYEKRAAKIKRHCVFIITTNNKLCLTDMTGNRRYPIIQCNSKPCEYVEGLLTDDYINQVWAEAWELYQDTFKTGFDPKKLELSKAAQIYFTEQAAEHTRDDLGDEIKDFLDTKILPNFIWKHFTKEERRKFFTDGRRLEVIEDDIISRRTACGGKDLQTDIDKIKLYLNRSDFSRRETISRKGLSFDIFYLYGSEYRDHICPAEIYHECFDKADRRKSIPKILECLNKLDGWTQGKRFRDQDTAYRDQKVVFYRDENNFPDADDDNTKGDTDTFSGEAVKPSDIPPMPAVITTEQHDPDDLPF